MRVATTADIPGLLDLMAEFYEESGYALNRTHSSAGFEALLANARLGGVWLAEAGPGPVGYVVLTICFSMEYGGLVGFVDDFFVRQSARGTGVGRGLLTMLREQARSGGLRALFVEVGPENAAALRAYQRLGFVDTHRQLLSLPLAAPSHSL